MEKPEEKNESSRSGTRMVAGGAVASIILWMLVLFLGNPIVPFTNPGPSFEYALVVVAPALFLSILAIVRAKASRKNQ